MSAAKISLDIAALVGPMSDVPCDHALHDEPGSGHHGPATHYVRKQCTGCEKKPTVYAACRGYLDMMTAYEVWECPRCGSFGPASTFSTVIGPVSS